VPFPPGKKGEKKTQGAGERLLSLGHKPCQPKWPEEASHRGVAKKKSSALKEKLFLNRKKKKKGGGGGEKKRRRVWRCAAVVLSGEGKKGGS